VVRRHSLKTKNAKTKTFSASAAKTVTGAVGVGNEVRLPNGRHKKIWETRHAIRAAAPSDRAKLNQSLRGRMQEAKQILLKGGRGEDEK
jgi:hypothetical protein